MASVLDMDQEALHRLLGTRCVKLSGTIVTPDTRDPLPLDFLTCCLDLRSRHALARLGVERDSAHGCFEVVVRIGLAESRKRGDEPFRGWLRQLLEDARARSEGIVSDLPELPHPVPGNWSLEPEAGELELVGLEEVRARQNALE